MKGYSSDNANVMLGQYNSVLSRVRERTDNQVFDRKAVYRGNGQVSPRTGRGSPRRHVLLV